ncbi:Phox homologous domain [Plasmopara halstedii]|uniref:Phox homologous domain n=1 Tax=Plasmopara halstedii TaxID=4781 RepID=A0A0P1AIB7_PLAHL|nr:Phox homologous domain [Plasmopara halstedii]CEG40880.1 Phox homologous domain [Plasmopara halstedii]|eukprot:XP_024577249.1 Phox homologous domain [Plasmopara halstedii]
MSRLVVSIGHVEFTGNREVLYVVKVQQDDDEWEVRRTYSDFRRLRDDIQRTMRDARTHILDDTCSTDFVRGLQGLPFPAKRLFGSKKDHVVKERAVELYRFLIKLLLLTHTYRKAQKSRYEHYVQSIPDHQKEAFVLLQERTQASISVFYLLRDFLKPITIKTDLSLQSGELLGSGRNSAGEESDDVVTKAIRESKILAMTSSNLGERKNYRELEKMSLKRQAQKQVLQEKEQHQSRQQSMEVAKYADDETGESSKLDAKSMRDQLLQNQLSSSKWTNEQQKKRHHSSPGHTNKEWRSRSARTTTSATTQSSVASSSPDESEPEMEKLTALSALASSTSSPASAEDVKLLNLSSLAHYTSKKSSRGETLSSNHSKSSLRSSKDKNSLAYSYHDKTNSSRTKRRPKSAKNVQLSDSERMSRVSLALNAQAISIHAQRELEKYLTEYSAIMILRFVDRFINKAVMKAPGCYRVNASNRLVIDGQRFFNELVETFADLPDNLSELFRAGSSDDLEEWGFPPALDKYVQLKWDSFQQAMRSSQLSCETGHSSAADQTSDSESSDTEYEYEEVRGGGYMTSKQHFSNDEESMLQEMIANGTAGREQVQRLRRQTVEQTWNRRINPGSRSHRVIEEASSSDSEEETRLQQREKRRSKRKEANRSVSCNVERYQKEQNAKRKDRLSRFGSQSIGGFV